MEVGTVSRGAPAARGFKHVSSIFQISLFPAYHTAINEYTLPGTRYLVSVMQVAHWSVYVVPRCEIEAVEHNAISKAAMQ